MRRFFLMGLVAVGLCLAVSVPAYAQTMMGGPDWLKQSAPIPSGMPGFSPSGVNSMAETTTAVATPKSDWAMDYRNGRGAWAPLAPAQAQQGQSGRPGFTVQQSGPTTTYTWNWPGQNGNRNVGYNGASNNFGYNAMTNPTALGASTPTLLQPAYVASPNYSARIVQQRTPNIYAPYQYTVQPTNTIPYTVRR